MPSYSLRPALRPLTLAIAASLACIPFVASAGQPEKAATMPQNAHATTYHYASVNGRTIFYREAGYPQEPVILLLHGFPRSRNMSRFLITGLADKFHVIDRK